LKRHLLWITSLLFFVSLSNLFPQSVITVSVPAGSYSVDQRIALSADNNEEIYYSFAESRNSRFVKYRFPFKLSAIDGEERLYTLRVEARAQGETAKKKEFTYLIDKKSPPAPAVSIPEGTYGNPISVSILPASDHDETVGMTGHSYYVCVNGSIDQNAELWAGDSIDLPAVDDGVATHTIKAYSKDSAGNLSALKVWTYTIDTSELLPVDRLQILSPISGAFANRQYLVIRASGYEWLRYTLGGEDPAEFGSEYVSPFLLNTDGEIRVRVAGKLISTGEIRTSEVEYTVNEAHVDLNRLQSGVYDEPLLVQLESSDTVYYSLDDTPAKRKALSYHSSFKIDLVKNGLKYLAFRVISEADLKNDLAEFRYFFILDDRTPSQPEIQFSQTPPVKDDADVAILGPDDSRIFYTIDGTSPDSSSFEYRGPFTLNLPADSEAGSLLVKAASFGPNGRTSTTASALVTFDRIAPTAPEIIFLGRNETAGITLGVRSEFGSDILFEMTLDDSLPRKPSLNSFLSNDYIELDVPYGMDRMFAFKFAAVDSAGNLSPSTDTFRVLVDKAPPESPVLNSANGLISIKGTDTVYYTLTDDGSEPAIPDSRSFEYSSPIPLQASDGALNETKIKAVAVDKSGNSSSVSNTFHVVEDRRKPYIPEYDGPKDGAVYASGQTLSLKQSADLPAVRYTLTTDGTEPLEPDDGSLFLEDELTFSGIDGASIIYRVKLKPYVTGGELSGDVAEIRFVVDRASPEMPVPMGIENGNIYNHGVFILPPADLTDEVYIVVSTDENEELDPLGEKGNRFTGPLRIDTEGLTEKTFRFSLAARDKAGNVTVNPETYIVTVDRLPPAKPVISGTPPGGLSRDSVELVVTSAYPVFYEITKDGSLPPVPTKESSRYEEKVLLGGESDREILYTARFLAFDEVGNSSRDSVERFSIDRLKPNALLSPGVRFAGDSTVSISWSGATENKIHYIVSAEANVSTDTFLEYAGPFTIPYEETEESLVLKYYSRDKAGNRSETGSMSLDLPGRTTESLFSGVENGMLYNSRRAISRDEKLTDVRYEVTTNGPIPVRLSPFSAKMPETLSFDAAPGETLNFAVRAAVFKQGDPSPVKEQIVRFTIDKTPPPAPEVANWRDEMFFQKDFQVELIAAEGNTYVSVNGGSYALYSSPITLQSVSGGIDRYEISAYTKDEAGNQSVQTRKWVAFIDRQVIYVSPEGNDLFDGSRSRPFRTLSAAIVESRSSERKTIYLSEGSYYLYEGINLSGALSISGGFTTGNWKETKASDTTRLIIAGEFTGVGPVFNVNEGAVINFKNLTMRSASGALDRTLIYQEAGELSILNCTISYDSYGPYPMFVQEAGKVEFEKSSFFSKIVSAPELFHIAGEKFLLTESSIGYEDAEGDVSLVRAENLSELFIADSILEPGTGRNTSGLYALSSNVRLKDTRIDSGQGKTKATSLMIQECDLDVDGAIFVGNRSSWISTCIDAQFSTIDLKNAIIDARAERGTVAIRAESTEIVLKSSRIRGLQGMEFIYLLNLTNCTGLVSGNMMSGTDTRDFIGMNIAGSSVGLVNNTLSIGSGENISVGISLNGSDDVRIVNNIIHGPSGYGNAIETNTVGRRMKILNNAFDGWRFYYTTPGLTATTLVSMNNADQTPQTGEIFGNIAEASTDTFSSSADGVFFLNDNSICVDGGFNPTLLNMMIREDYEGESRVDPFDIGADEAY
jgi:hypothetical protein